MKYYTNNTEIRAFDDDVNPADWVDLSAYREMTDDEVDKHENPEKYISDAEKLAIKRLAMPDLTRVKLFKALYLTKKITESDIQSVIDAIEDEDTKIIAQIEFQTNAFERNNAVLIQAAHGLGVSDDEIDALWEQAAQL